MNKIYIVFTYTGTILARIVKFYTKEDYSHVSIALDKDLNKMYSFGRLNPYNPFIGGFVQESPKYGTFKRFKKTKTKIYSLEVNEKQYKEIVRIIEDINNNKSNYKFNVIGLFAVALKLRVKRERCFYCAEFVKYIFDCSDLSYDLPDIIKPIDFLSVNGLEEIYSGMLSEYN